MLNERLSIESDSNARILWASKLQFNTEPRSRTSELPLLVRPDKFNFFVLNWGLGG